MARSVQIRDYFSIKAQAIFLNFTIYLFYWKVAKFKNLATFQICLTLIKQLSGYELYTLLYHVFIALPYLPNR